MPRSETFLRNQDVTASFLPKEMTIQSHEFETCNEANCNDFSSERKFKKKSSKQNPPNLLL